MPRVLIVEDEPDIALGLVEDLTANGYSVEVAGDGDTALRVGREKQWDLILLDVMLPRRDGFEVCRQLRRDGVRTPIILLTAKAHEAEKVLGLELGADDYVTKPFSIRELRARMQAVLRRAEPAEEQVARFGDCEVNFGRAELRRAGRLVEVTALELRLLQAFLRRRGLVLTRTQLIEDAWGGDTFVSERVVDTHILNLRKKIEADPAAPEHLRSVRGIGYRFDS
jgi:two-component system alkaline phosphatase synthesis response regulator PhoP